MQNDLTPNLAAAFRAGRTRYQESRKNMEGMRNAGRNLQTAGMKMIGAGLLLMVGIFFLIVVTTMIF
jgi:hypothetical protein